jgi:hypothetical protein
MSRPVRSLSVIISGTFIIWASSVRQSLSRIDNWGLHWTSIGLLLGSGRHVRGPEFFIEPKLVILGGIFTQKVEFTHRDGSFTLHLFGVMVENSDSKLSKVANKCLAGMNYSGSWGIGFVEWYNPLGGEDRLQRAVDTSDSSDIIRALHESGFLTKEVSINRGVSVIAHRCLWC